MLVRRRRPLLRASMVGGTAYHAGKKIEQGREADAEQDGALAQPEAQANASPPPAAAAPAATGAVGISDATLDQLRKLAELKQEGVLTQEEFDAQKQKLLRT